MFKFIEHFFPSARRQTSNRRNKQSPNEPSPQKAQILSLPNEILHHIFRRVPIRDLLVHVSLTCTQFEQLKISACAIRRSLTLTLGGQIRFCSFDRDYIQRDSVHLNKSKSSYDHYNKYALLSLSTIRVSQLEALKQTFPNIRFLQISASEEDKVQSPRLLLVTKLLECWRANLSALHIFTNFRLINPKQSFLDETNVRAMNRIYLRLFNTINRMCHLRSLIFCTENVVTLQSFELLIIAQLEVFYFSPHYSTVHPQLPVLNLLSEELLKYGSTNDRLKSVGLGAMITIHWQHQLAQLLSDRSNRHFLAKFTHLTIAIFQESEIDYFVDMLYPLRGTLFSLSINHPANLPLMIAIITKLRPLIELPESRIECLKLKLLYQENQPFNHNPDNSALTKQFLASISLPSIRYLYLRADNFELTDNNFKNMWNKWCLAGIFPNLKLVNINRRLLTRRKNLLGERYVTF